MIEGKPPAPPAYQGGTPSYPAPQAQAPGQAPIYVVHPPQQQAPHPPQHPQHPPSAAQIGQQYQQELYARCAQGNHDPHTKFGVCGIITAIIFFPIGLIFLLVDKETRCARCGVLVG